MAECHIVNVGRDSRILAVTAQIRRTLPGLVLTFERRGEVMPLTEVRLTPTQAFALANELVGFSVQSADEVWDEVLRACRAAWPGTTVSYGQSPIELITRLIDERDEARAALHPPRFVRDLGGERFESRAPGGSSPPPSTDV